jgi:hypothetical protein
MGIPIGYPLFKRGFGCRKQPFKIKLISINFYFELPFISNKYQISKYHIKNIRKINILKISKFQKYRLSEK